MDLSIFFSPHGEPFNKTHPLLHQLVTLIQRGDGVVPGTGQGHMTWSGDGTRKGRIHGRETKHTSQHFLPSQWPFVSGGASPCEGASPSRGRGTFPPGPEVGPGEWVVLHLWLRQSHSLGPHSSPPGRTQGWTGPNGGHHASQGPRTNTQEYLKISSISDKSFFSPYSRFLEGTSA